ncbi:MmgE/PrpD family protein [Niallia alba]|uniref:MmgE/PrpD family protein n=1 Tax=Niallia alba TaxID=2729105 RepID=UPI0039A1CE56
MSDLTREIVRMIQSTPSYNKLASETKKNLEMGVFDYFLSCFASVQFDLNYSTVLNTAIFSTGEEASVIGTDLKIHPFDACLINGYSAHALDLDDVHSEIRGHPSAIILSLLHSLIEKKRDRERFYEAYLIGIETMKCFAQLLGAQHYEKGFHTTATAGIYGAVAAGAHYLNFDSEKFAQAINLCVSKLSGSRSQFGTMVKPLHAGMTAQSAWQILHFIDKGIAGSINTIQAKNGLISMYVEQRENPFEIFEKWGDPWAIDKPGLWFKLYPCCSANAHAIDAIQYIKTQKKFSVDEVAFVDLYFPPNGDAALVYTHPENGEQGRFSVEYCVALLLLGEALSIENFSVDQIADDVNQVMKKIHRKYDHQIPVKVDSYPKGRYCMVKVTLKDGQQLVSRVDAPTGSPGKPLKMKDLVNKANTLLGEQANTLNKYFAGGIEGW